jgi:methyl-accepting chemotaxis protein
MSGFYEQLPGRCAGQPRHWDFWGMSGISSGALRTRRGSLSPYLILLLIFSGWLTVAAAWQWYTHSSLGLAKQQYIEEAQQGQVLATRKVEEGLKSIYENLRTLASLPSVRNITRHGENFSEEARVTFQQIYNNLATNVDVSEVYVVPESLDHAKIDPVTVKPEEPIVMFDELITGAGPIGTRKSVLSDGPGQLEEEKYEYEQFKIKFAWIRENYPLANSENPLAVPFFTSPSIITCDNTDYTETKIDADRMGVIFSVPFYGMDGKLKGTVSAIIRNAALRKLLPATDYALVNPFNGYVNLASKSDFLSAAGQHIAAAKLDNSLIFSGVAEVPSADPQSKWYLWAGHPDAMYYDSPHYKAAAQYRFYGFCVIALLGLFSVAFWWQVLRHAKNAAIVAASSAEQTRQQGALVHVDRMMEALQTASTPFMFVDSDRTIVAINAAALAMFESAAENLRTAISGFDAGSIKGRSVNIFGQDVFEHLNSAGNMRLSLGDCHFNIIITPVSTDMGESLGSSIEWRDVTAQVATEKQINAIVRAAGKGDFSRRVNLTQKDGFLGDLAKSINELTATVDLGLSNTVTMVSAMARGDISERFTGEFSGAFARLQTDANFMAEKMNSVAENIATVSGDVEFTARELGRGMTHLASRTSSEAAALEETSVSMKEFTDTIRRIATQTGLANKLAEAALATAGGGRDIAMKAIEAVTGIQESSKRTNEIVGLIQDIAFQTNLLSLNASVEAARAGDAGRGFAVVASEVRALSQRTAQASKDIRALISHTDTQVQNGVDLVKLAGNSLADILAAVHKLGKIVAEISAASSEQAVTVEQVSRTFSSLDESTQQNAALASEANIALHDAHQKIGLLRQAVSFFKVKEVKQVDASSQFARRA